MISCLECKYSKQIGEKSFYCFKYQRNVMLQICKLKQLKTPKGGVNMIGGLVLIFCMGLVSGVLLTLMIIDMKRG